MRESELLANIYARSGDLGAAFPSIVVGPGDDCAVVKVGGAAGGELLLLKVDQVVERRHFLSSTRVHLIARKAIARAVSDIAAMGGSPRWSLASGVLPPEYPHADDLCRRLAEWGRHWDAPVVGGDIATGAPGNMLSLSITVVGVPHPARGPVLRSTARPGDEVWVTGSIGNSVPSEHHLTFEPRLTEALRLCDALGADLHAMIDVSDGLGRDAGRVAEASGVRVVIDAERVPLSPGATDCLAAAGHGEDYELVFCVAPGAQVPDVGATRIGRVEAGSGCVLVMGDGRVVEAGELGWDH